MRGNERDSVLAKFWDFLSGKKAAEKIYKMFFFSALLLQLHEATHPRTDTVKEIAQFSLSLSHVKAHFDISSSPHWHFAMYLTENTFDRNEIYT